MIRNEQILSFGPQDERYNAALVHGVFSVEITGRLAVLPLGRAARS